VRSIKYSVWNEPPYYVAQCLSVEVSSFGETAEDAVRNLMEAVDLYFDDNQTTEIRPVEPVC